MDVHFESEQLSSGITCPYIAVVLFFFASPKKKRTKRKKATLGQWLRRPKDAKRYFGVLSFGIYRRHGAGFSCRFPDCYCATCYFLALELLQGFINHISGEKRRHHRLDDRVAIGLFSRWPNNKMLTCLTTAPASTF